MSPFDWQFWRIGWAYDAHTVVYGWRRIAGRLWIYTGRRG